MADELCYLLKSIPGEGSSPSVQMSCFESMLGKTEKEVVDGIMTHLHLLAVPSALFRPHSIARHLFDQIAQPPPVPTRKTLLRLFIVVSSSLT
ncbi:hypothetical protein HPP92_024665 [Vanilla planifolia]|uniref:Uncharacterized protein n=1 Tax=Vanilla planifolia TaxID=51239 RepID=A0A835PQ87_VANPL|nr:hypothetical protein HPP92_024665 [Vanilla planifolia]